MRNISQICFIHGHKGHVCIGMSHSKLPKMHLLGHSALRRVDGEGCWVDVRASIDISEWQNLDGAKSESDAWDILRLFRMNCNICPFQQAFQNIWYIVLSSVPLESSSKNTEHIVFDYSILDL